MSTKILILGAGYAGIETALTLYKKKKKSDNIEITLIDKNPYHTLLTELHEVAGNRIEENGITVPLRDIFRYTNVNLVRDEINNIDFGNNKLISDSSEYNYDYLVIAAGSHPNFHNIPGMEEHCFPLWSYNDAISIREHIEDCFIRASQETDYEKRKPLLTFIVGGGGFTGVEMVGELALWVKQLCKYYSINRNEVRIILVEALPEILNNLDDKSIKKANRYLTKKLGVEVLKNKPITKLTADFAELGDGTVIPTKTLIWTAGVKACNITDNICIEKGNGCKIKVNDYTQTQYNNVYAIGDISLFNAENRSLPALVESALQTGKAAAHNILAEIRGQEKKLLKPKLHGVMVSIGSYFAVSNIMGKRLPRLLSIIMKYMVNIHYLFGIGGFELVARYLKHEFLYKKQNKTIVERHISVTTPSLWLVPVRIFLGYSWLMEGIAKLRDGWLTTPFLSGLPTDGNTSASVAETGEKVFQIVFEYTPKWYAWIADTIIIPNALLFQVLIVLTEIGLGIAFITGTFTFLAAIVSLGMNINFLLSTGLYPENWWFIPASLAMLGGAGRAFGVDHYLIPYLMRQWRYFVRNRKLKLQLFR
ncbi:MAG: FAD-dependent oxidoreductase [Acetivibrionales bacterium]